MFFTVLAILTALIFAFINGFHDGCNVIATIITSRSITPKKALITACIFEFLGPLFLGTAVAKTIGKGVIYPTYLTNSGETVSTLMVISALFGGIIWNLITWKLELPSSSSHALIGGLVGAGAAAYGFKAINLFNLFWKVIFILLITPFIGFAVGYALFKISVLVFKNFHSKINIFFKKIQYFSMIFLAISHGTSDSQKAMGIITMVLMVNGLLTDFTIPFWVKVGSALALSLGLSMGGWAIVKTVGTKIYKVRALHSFNAHISAASVIITATLLGGPVSTTQIVSSSIMGVGAGESFKNVRWDTVRNVLLSWITTIPAAAVVAAGCFWLGSLLYNSLFLK